MKYYKLNDKKEVVECSIDLWYDVWNIERRRVAYNEEDNCIVSTVFLVTDHNYTLTGPPIFFETKVFYTDGMPNAEQRKYSTWDEAMEGHRELCKKWLKLPTYRSICTGIRAINLGH